MASNLHHVHANIRWRIETCTPQLTRGGLGSFKYLNATPAAQSTGTSRGFTVGRPRAGEIDGTTNCYSRIQDLHFMVEVFYGSHFTPEALAEVIEQDRHSLIKQLRDQRLWKGYDATHTTDDIGLMARWPEPDEVTQVGSLTVLRLPWRCKVKEIE